MLEHECPRCHREVELPMGALCKQCRREIETRAVRVARWVSGITTPLVALYVWLRMPHDRTAQLVGIMSVAIWYTLSRLVALRTAREWFRTARVKREV